MYEMRFDVPVMLPSVCIANCYDM